jgi:hypothetical protein
MVSAMAIRPVARRQCALKNPSHPFQVSSEMRIVPGTAAPQPY